MAKMKKYPKKPKASASLQTKENYLKKRSEVDKYNKRLKSDKEKSKKLSQKIAGL